MLPYAAYPVHPTPPIVPQQQQQQQQRQQNVPEIRHLKVLARAQALYDFPGGDTGDLLFKTGDIISVIEYSNDDWWRGVLGYEIGVFPSAYVQRLKTPLGHVFKSIAVSVRTSTVAPPPTDHAGYVSTPQHHYLDDPPPYS
ncbi:MAG: SH3 domain-containing protein [Linnemannia gamsii]|nr:MAG: SH3 domain-containing protein [Linnemannia gamsii]